MTETVMRIQLFLAATLRKHVEGYDPTTGYELDVAEGTTVRQLLKIIGIPEEEVKLIMVNGVVSKRDTRLLGGERVALFPPVGGG